MEDCNTNKVISLLKGISLIGSSLTTGISIYIQFVDHKSILSLPTEYGVSQFKERYKRVLLLQLGLTISTVFSSFMTFISIYNSNKFNSKIPLCGSCKGGGYLWFLGSLLMLSTLPYTYLRVSPINKKLLSKDLDSYGDKAKSLLVKWGKLHRPRSLLLITATICFFIKLFKLNK